MSYQRDIAFMLRNAAKWRRQAMEYPPKTRDRRFCMGLARMALRAAQLERLYASLEQKDATG